MIKVITIVASSTPITKVIKGDKSVIKSLALAVMSSMKPAGNVIIDNIIFIITNAIQGTTFKLCYRVAPCKRLLSAWE